MICTKRNGLKINEKKMERLKCFLGKKCDFKVCLLFLKNGNGSLSSSQMHRFANITQQTEMIVRIRLVKEGIMIKAKDKAAPDGRYVNTYQLNEKSGLVKLLMDIYTFVRER